MSAIHHIAIAAYDPEKLACFYGELFGFERLDYPEIAAGSVWLALGELMLTPLPLDDSGRPVVEDHPTIADLANAPILMIEQAASAPAPESDFSHKAPGYHLLAFAIEAEERAAWLTRIGDAGVVIAGESAYSIYLRDPEGNRVALSHF